jgi:hypothetical protein
MRITLHTAFTSFIPHDPCPWKIGVWEVRNGTSNVTAFNSEEVGARARVELEQSRDQTPLNAIRSFSSRKAQIEQSRLFTSIISQGSAWWNGTMGWWTPSARSDS